MSRRWSRRKRKSGLLAKAPWQLNLTLAAAFGATAYFHKEASAIAISLASTQVDAPTVFTAFTPIFSLWTMIGGAVVATACTGHAAADMFKKNKARRERESLLRQAQQAAHNTRTLDQLEWREFEFLVGQVFREQGYKVSEGRGVQDGGVDITLVRGNQRILVQCKHWKTTTVGVAVVRELAGVVQLNKANGGVVVCSGRFTKDAFEEAQKLGIQLITGSDLLQHIEKLGQRNE